MIKNFNQSNPLNSAAFNTEKSEIRNDNNMLGSHLAVLSESTTLEFYYQQILI